MSKDSETIEHNSHTLFINIFLSRSFAFIPDFLNFARDKQYVLGTISIINVMKPTNLLLFPIIILCSFTSVKEIPPYKNPALPVDERVKDLLGRMTIEEKFWQTYMMPGDLDKGKDRFSHGIFGFQVSTIGTSNPELKQLLQYNPKLTAKEMAKKSMRSNVTS